MSRMIDLEKKDRVHFVGVGGIGMSALARYFMAEKKNVSGSDRTLTPLTKTLATEGMKIYGEQVAENITKDIDLIIYTEAMSEEHEEMVAARNLKVPMINLFEAEGLAFNPYYLIAVSGTHGKTTTTAMLTDIFESAEKDPTAIIGSLRAKTQTNFRFGKSKYAIVEACEYKRDFLHLTPDILVITNLEYDHPDYYEDLKDVQEAFREMISKVHDDGVIVTDTKNPNIIPVIENCGRKVVDYSEFVDLKLELKQPGIHNRMNAAAAVATAAQEKIPTENSKLALAQFTGTWRRFEYKGSINGAKIYDDYAHHPTAIVTTINGAREMYPDHRVVAVFQPHTFSRTASLFDDFAKALARADRVVLLPIYGAREENTTGVNSRELAVKTLEYTRNVRYVESSDEAEQELRNTLNEKDILIMMGAGKDVPDLANALIVK